MPPPHKMQLHSAHGSLSTLILCPTPAVDNFSGLKVLYDTYGEVDTIVKEGGDEFKMRTADFTPAWGQPYAEYLLKKCLYRCVCLLHACWPLTSCHGGARPQVVQTMCYALQDLLSVQGALQH